MTTSHRSTAKIRRGRRARVGPDSVILVALVLAAATSGGAQVDDERAFHAAHGAWTLHASGATIVETLTVRARYPDVTGVVWIAADRALTASADCLLMVDVPDFAAAPPAGVDLTEVLTTFEGEDLTVLVSSRSCAHVVAATRQGRVIVKDRRAGTTILDLRLSERAMRKAAVADSGLVAVIDDDRHLIVLDPFAADPEARVAKADIEGVSAVAFSADGGSLLVGRDDGRVGVLPTGGATLVSALTSGAGWRWFPGHTQTVNALAPCPTRRRVASGSDDKTLRVIDLDSGISHGPITGPSSGVISAAFDLTGTVLLAGTYSGDLWRWRLDDGDEKAVHATWLATRDLGDEMLTGLEVASDRVLVCTGTQVFHVTSHPTAFEARFGDVGLPKIGALYHAALSRDGCLVAAVGTNHLVQVWDVAGGRRSEPSFGHSGTTTSVAFSPVDGRLVSGSADGTARIHGDSAGASPIVLGGHDEAINAVAWSPDGKWIATGGRDDRVRLFDARTGTLAAVFAGHDDDVKCVAFDARGRRLASSSDDGTVRIVALADRRLERVIEVHATSVHGVAFDPNDEWIATGSLDHSVRFFAAEDGRRLAEVVGFDRGVNVLAVDPTGSRIATGCSDGGIRIVEARLPHAVRLVRRRPVSAVAVQFTPDGRHVMAAWADGTIESIDTGDSGAIRPLASPPGDGVTIRNGADWILGVGARHAVLIALDAGHRPAEILSYAMNRRLDALQAAEWLVGEAAGAAVSRAAVDIKKILEQTTLDAIQSAPARVAAGHSASPDTLLPGRSGRVVATFESPAARPLPDARGATVITVSKSSTLRWFGEAAGPTLDLVSLGAEGQWVWQSASGSVIVGGSPASPPPGSPRQPALPATRPHSPAGR